MYFSDTEYTVETLLLASAVDNLAFLAWAKTRDAEKGRNKPDSIVQKLLSKDDNKKDEVLAFETGEEFDIAWAEAVRGI